MVDLDDRVVKAVHVSARQAHYKHRGYVDYMDLVQEGYSYLLENPELMDELDETGIKVLTKSVQYAMNRYGMRQRYLKDGTAPGDYFRYTSAMVRELMPDVFARGALSDSVSDLNEDRRGSKTLSERGDRLAMVADIGQALTRVSVSDAELVMLKFDGGELPDEVLALQLEISPDATRKRVQRALVRIARNLNGDYEPKRARRVRSNASAQVFTRRQESAE